MEVSKGLEGRIKRNFNRKGGSIIVRNDEKSFYLKWQKHSPPTPRHEMSPENLPASALSRPRGWCWACPGPPPPPDSERVFTPARPLRNRKVMVRLSRTMLPGSYMIGQAPPGQLTIRRRKWRHWFQLAACCLLTDLPVPRSLHNL